MTEIEGYDLPAVTTIRVSSSLVIDIAFLTALENSAVSSKAL